MVFELIFLAIALLALGVVVFEVVSKFTRLVLLDLDAMPAARMKVRKQSLIEERLERKLGNMRGAIKGSANPLWAKIKDFFLAQYQKLLKLEQRYKQSARRLKPKTQEEKEKLRGRVAVLVDEGGKFLEQSQYVEAEKKFIEAVSLDPKNVDAFEHLGEIYYYQKDFDHALETLTFAKRLNPKNDHIYLDMGMIKMEQGKAEQAIIDFKRAVELSPNNPKNLDCLLNAALVGKKKYEATRAFDQLSKVNPENQKLVEYKAAVDGL